MHDPDLTISQDAVYDGKMRKDGKLRSDSTRQRAHDKQNKIDRDRNAYNSYHEEHGHPKATLDEGEEMFDEEEKPILTSEMLKARTGKSYRVKKGSDDDD